MTMKVNGIVRQLIRPPEGSVIKGITLMRGASKDCPWATLRGGVIKFGPSRQGKPVTLNGMRYGGNGLVVKAGWVLCDTEAFEYTKYTLNRGADIKHHRLTMLNHESMYLVHSSFTHPNELFLPQGTFMNSTYERSNAFPEFITHFAILWEEHIHPPVETEGANTIIVKLKGNKGKLVLQNNDIYNFGKL